jgi:hypothetical protein
MSKPRWDCSKPRDAQNMTKWVNNALDFRDNKIKYLRVLGEGLRSFDPAYLKMKAIEQADRGNIGPLRLLFPDLAKFLCPPKQKRGQRFPRNKESDPVAGAAIDAKEIRTLWKFFYGKRNRPRNDPVTAEQIAADRWGVDVEAVIARLKKQL